MKRLGYACARSTPTTLSTNHTSSLRKLAARTATIATQQTAGARPSVLCRACAVASLYFRSEGEIEEFFRGTGDEFGCSNDGGVHQLQAIRGPSASSGQQGTPFESKPGPRKWQRFHGPCPQGQQVESEPGANASDLAEAARMLTRAIARHTVSIQTLRLDTDRSEMALAGGCSDVIQLREVTFTGIIQS